VAEGAWTTWAAGVARQDQGPNQLFVFGHSEADFVCGSAMSHAGSLRGVQALSWTM